MVSTNYLLYDGLLSVGLLGKGDASGVSKILPGAHSTELSESVGTTTVDVPFSLTLKTPTELSKGKRPPLRKLFTLSFLESQNLILENSEERF